MPTELETLLTTSDVARLLNVEPTTIHQQRWQNLAPGALGFKVGRRVLFRRKEVEDWLSEVQASELRNRERDR